MPRSSSSLKPMVSKLPTTSTSSDVSNSIFSSDAAAMLLVPRLCEGAVMIRAWDTWHEGTHIGANAEIPANMIASPIGGRLL